MKLLRFTYDGTICEMDHLGNWTLIIGDPYVRSALDFQITRFELQPGSPSGNFAKEVQEIHKSTGIMRSGVFEELNTLDIPEDESGALF